MTDTPRLDELGQVARRPRLYNFLGDMVRLRVVEDNDHPTLFEWRSSPDLHYLSADPSTGAFDEFQQWLRSVQRNNAFFMVEDMAGNNVGYALTYSANLWSGSIYYASYIAPERRRSLFAMEVLPICGQFLFCRFPIRKLYVEIYETASRLRDYLLGIGYEDEGFMANQVLHGGEYIGVWTLALTRDAWRRRLANRPRTRSAKR